MPGIVEETTTTTIKYLSELLRHTGSGFVFLLGTWAAGDKTLIRELRNDMDMSYWPFLVLGSVAGFVLYALHRNRLQRVVYRFVLGSWENVHALDEARWSGRYSEDRKTWAIVRELDIWSALVDFLYTSAWAPFASGAVIYLRDKPLGGAGPVLTISGLFLVIAILGDRQVIRAERRFLLPHA
jgi:hypothetical protein